MLTISVTVNYQHQFITSHIIIYSFKHGVQYIDHNLSDTLPRSPVDTRQGSCKLVTVIKQKNIEEIVER